MEIIRKIYVFQNFFLQKFFNFFSFYFSHHKKLILDVGYPINENDRFPGHLREFSANVPQSIHMPCAEVILSRHPRLERQLAEADANELAEERGVITNNVDSESASDLEERIQFLEAEVQHFRDYVNKFDQRIKTVELHQRGCMVDGHLLHFGQKNQDMLNCTQCQCSSTGRLHCGPIGCPHLKCDHPFKPEGSCCPVCGKQVKYGTFTIF